MIFLEILLLLQCVVIDDEQDFPISFGVAGIPKVMQKPEHALRKNSHQWQPKGPQLSTKKKKTNKNRSLSAPISFHIWPSVNKL